MPTLDQFHGGSAHDSFQVIRVRSESNHHVVDLEAVFLARVKVKCLIDFLLHCHDCISIEYCESSEQRARKSPSFVGSRRPVRGLLKMILASQKAYRQAALLLDLCGRRFIEVFEDKETSRRSGSMDLWTRRALLLLHRSRVAAQ